MSEPVRRRGVLGISGWMLFACLFLPTLRVCGDPMMPLQFPPTYGVYIGGVLVAVIGFTTLHRRREYLLVALLGIYLASILTFFALFLGGEVHEAVGVIAGAGFLAVLVMMMRRAVRAVWSERAVAVGCFLHGMIAAAWSALLAFDPDGMWGAQVSLGAASLMLFAAGGYLVHEVKDPSVLAAEPPLPEARMM